MTNEEINVAIARACPGIAEIDADNGGPFWKHPDRFVIFSPATDLNAIHEATVQFGLKQTVRFSDHLKAIIEDELCIRSAIDARYMTLHATARQRSEAFLRTLGLWVEPKKEV